MAEKKGVTYLDSQESQFYCAVNVSAAQPLLEMPHVSQKVGSYIGMHHAREMLREKRFGCGIPLNTAGLGDFSRDEAVT